MARDARGHGHQAQMHALRPRGDAAEPYSIIIDADDTNADTYGAQQLTLFNAYYWEY